jgi:hypothetical protein
LKEWYSEDLPCPSVQGMPQRIKIKNVKFGKEKLKEE